MKRFSMMFAVMIVFLLVAKTNARRTDPAPAFIDLSKCVVDPNPCLEGDFLICGPLKVSNSEYWDVVKIVWSFDWNHQINGGGWAWENLESGEIMIFNELPHYIGDPFDQKVSAPYWPASNGNGPFQARFTFTIWYKKNGQDWHTSESYQRFVMVYRAT